jgi:kynureninase
MIHLYSADKGEYMLNRQDCQDRDRKDPLRALRDRYHIPEGTIYFDGNSLGLLPKAAVARVSKAVTDEWGRDLITSWNKHGWFQLAQVTGSKISRLIGGGDDNVIVADTISINMFKVLTSALALRRDRKVILSDSGNFPSDLYVAQGLNAFLNDGHTLKVVAPEDVLASIGTDVAAVMVTEVDYRTARRHDMNALTKRAHDHGALIIWDLAHSAGAVPVDLLGANADFAVGCTYKYLNGGPGSPAFLFVHPRLQAAAVPALVGWWGHATPFEFSPDYVPAKGIRRQQCGTQPILNFQALDAALDQWGDVDMHDLKQKSDGLCQFFIDRVEHSCGQFGLRLAGPRNMAERGAHVSFHCPNGYAVMQALISQKIVGDFRAPDLIRFGFSGCYNTFTEVFDATARVAEIMQNKLWQRPEFLEIKPVT